MQVDFYSALVEKLFATGLAIQSWRRGIGAMRSSCPPAVLYKSLNVSGVDRVALRSMIIMMSLQVEHQSDRSILTV